METGLLHDYSGNISTRGERYYFTRGEIETNIGKLRNSEKLKFPFWVEGPLVIILERVGGGGRRLVVGGRGSRWGAVRDQIRWVGGSYGPDRSSKGQMGSRHLGLDGGG